MSRCTGHCCRAFTLPFSPQRLYEKACFTEDGLQILDMVIYLGLHASYPGVWNPQKLPHHIYTCRHHDAESGNCSIYDRRPRMCSEYPYGSRCMYQGCTATQADVLVRALTRKVEQRALTAKLDAHFVRERAFVDDGWEQEMKDLHESGSVRVALSEEE